MYFCLCFSTLLGFLNMSGFIILEGNYYFLPMMPGGRVGCTLLNEKATNDMIDIKPFLEATKYGEYTYKYLYDFDEEIYDQTIEVCFLEYKRPEQQFESLEALKEQLKKDIEENNY